jgi:hypothetical protein
MFFLQEVKILTGLYKRERKTLNPKPNVMDESTKPIAH